jgi:hypothetical protein
MIKASMLSAVEIAEMDCVYRAGGLKNMASPHIHYEEPHYPHSGCNHKMEWIDFRLELVGDRQRFYNPLVRAWWEGTGFVGRCPACHEYVHFTTLGMRAVTDEVARGLPQLPENWHTVAQFG